MIVGDYKVIREMTKIIVTTHGRVEHELEVENEVTVLDAIRSSDFAPEGFAVCGGGCACATCHVYIHPDFVNVLPPMEGDEDALLDIAYERRPESRLACQIHVVPELDGLRVELPAE